MLTGRRPKEVLRAQAVWYACLAAVTAWELTSSLARGSEAALASGDDPVVRRNAHVYGLASAAAVASLAYVTWSLSHLREIAVAVAGGRVLALTLFAPTIFGTGAVFDAGLMSVAGGPVPFFGPIVPAMELFFFFWIVDALARDTSAPVTHWTRPREPGPRTMLHCVHAGVLVVGGLTALLRPGAITSLGGLPAFAQSVYAEVPQEGFVAAFGMEGWGSEALGVAWMGISPAAVLTCATRMTSLYGLIGAWFSIEAVFMVNVFCAGLRLGTLAVVIATGWSEGLWVLVLAIPDVALLVGDLLVTSAAQAAEEARLKAEAAVKGSTTFSIAPPATIRSFVAAVRMAGERMNDDDDDGDDDDDDYDGAESF